MEVAIGILRAALNENFKVCIEYPDWLQEKAESMAYRTLAVFGTTDIKIYIIVTRNTVSLFTKGNRNSPTIFVKLTDTDWSTLTCLEALLLSFSLNHEDYIACEAFQSKPTNSLAFVLELKEAIIAKMNASKC